MAKSDTLILNDTFAEAKAQKSEVVVCVRDDDDFVLGYVGCTQWLADRAKVLIAKIIKDTGCAAAEFINIMTQDEEPKQPEAPKKTNKATKKPTKAGSGLEGDTSSEQGLIATYGDKIIPGTLRFETSGIHAGKRTVEIRCRQLLVAHEDGSGYDWGDDFTKETRRVATSDLFQVHGSAADHAMKRKADRRHAAKLRKLNSK